ncbi:MAG: hypothetical protein SF182_01635 [Deltaproteobacteria bacterium]|nr:hypothetical protein [Deltaproteobacteria bacterium]
MQVSRKHVTDFERRVARGFAAMHARLTDLQRQVEAHGLAIKETLHLSTAQMARFRQRVDELHTELSAAAAIGEWLADLGHGVNVPGAFARAMTFAELGALEREASSVTPPVEVDFFDLIGPDPEARPQGMLARWLGRRAA